MTRLSEQGTDWNFGEEDHEGEMATSQLHRLADMATKLLEIVKEGDELPGWVQSKIATSLNDLNDVFGWMEPASHQMEEGKGSCSGCKGKNPGLWCNICRKRKRGERAAKSGEKGYPKTLNIESRLYQQFDKLTKV